MSPRRIASLERYTRGTGESPAVARCTIACRCCAGKGLVLVDWEEEACRGCGGEGFTPFVLQGVEAVRAALTNGTTTWAQELQALGLGYEGKQVAMAAPGALHQAWTALEQIVRFSMRRGVPHQDVSDLACLLREGLDGEASDEVARIRQQLAALKMKGGVRDVDQAAE